MSKEHFTYPASKTLVQLFDETARRTGHARGRVFTDFLTVSKCALAGQTMEDEYLATIGQGYTSGPQGQRGIDRLAEGFAMLVGAMEDTRADVLGNIFQGAITYGENGQFFTPDAVCDLMAAITVPADRTDAPKSVCDPACGSGRQLLSVAKRQPHWELIGQDIDHRAVMMTAINLGLNGLRGWAVHQNTLTLEVHRVYKIGFNLAGGVIADVPVEQSPFNLASTIEATPETNDAKPRGLTISETTTDSHTQLDLF